MFYLAFDVPSSMAKDRFTSEEARCLDRLQLDLYKDARLAAEVHRTVSII